MPCYEFVCEGHIFIVSSLGRIMLVEMLRKGTESLAHVVLRVLLYIGITTLLMMCPSVGVKSSELERPGFPSGLHYLACCVTSDNLPSLSEPAFPHF